MKRRKPAIISVIAVVVAAVMTSPASAGGGSPASGVGLETSNVVTSVTQVGAATIIDATAISVMSGTLSGVVEQDYRTVFTPTGRITAWFGGTFTGTLGDCGPVSLDFVSTLHGTVADFAGHATSIGSDGPTFSIGFTGGGLTLSYSGTYHC